MSAATYTEAVISVVCGTHQEQIAAFVCGPLAYHRSLTEQPDSSADYATVTHVPTGKALAVYMPGREAAVRLLERCLATPGIDWACTDPDYFANLRHQKRQKIQSLLAEIRKWQ